MPPEFGSMFAQAGGARQHARRGARPAEARAGRQRRRGVGRADEPVVPAAGARAARDAAGHGRRRLARPHDGRRDGACPSGTRRSRCCRPPIEVYEAEAAEEVESFFASAARLRPTVRAEIGRPVELSYRGHRYALRVLPRRRGPVPHRGRRHAARRRGRARRAVRALADHRRPAVPRAGGRPGLHAARSKSKACRTRSRAPTRAWCARASPAVVVSVQVAPGDEVAAGDRLAVLEAMKMEMGVTAPFPAPCARSSSCRTRRSGRARRWCISTRVPTRAARKTGPEGRVRRGARRRRPAAGRPASRARALLRGVKAGLEELKRPGAGAGGEHAAGAAVGAARASTSTPRTSRRFIQDYERLAQSRRGRTTRPWCRPKRSCCASSSTCGRSSAASRTRTTRSSRRSARSSTSTRTSGRSTRRAPTCRRRSSSS